MPVSNEAIAGLFRYLGGQGYRRPDSWKKGVPGNPTKAEIFASWRHTFRNVDDADLLAAGTVYVANGGQWWPNAGQLIACLAVEMATTPHEQPDEPAASVSFAPTAIDGKPGLIVAFSF